jgi:DNA mismatch endonuclease (patch repair protein)
VTDIVSPEVRSRMMSGIRAKNTRPELVLRRALHALGFRYRLHVRNLPGKPDLVFPKYRAIIQVHGCFWHRHGCSKTTDPASNSEFWQMKFARNVVRDREVECRLRELGWRVGIVWECEIASEQKLLWIDAISRFIRDPETNELELDKAVNDDPRPLPK